jgi:hypothetical protein
MKDFGNDAYSGDCFDIVDKISGLDCNNSKDFVEIFKKPINSHLPHRICLTNRKNSPKVFLILARKKQNHINVLHGVAAVFHVIVRNSRDIYAAVLLSTNILSLTGQGSLTIFLFTIDYFFSLDFKNFITFNFRNSISVLVQLQTAILYQQAADFLIVIAKNCCIYIPKAQIHYKSVIHVRLLC